MSQKVIFFDGGCQDCQKVAAFLSAHGVDYERKNVKGHPELMAEVKKNNLKTLPAIMVGSTVVEGYNEQKLRTALKVA